jgi:CubicO group peptidase (beta-lactamase class C family)
MDRGRSTPGADRSDLDRALDDPASMAARALLSPPLLQRADAINAEAVLSAEWAAVNGTATASALALLGSEFVAGSGGKVLAEIRTPVSDGPDAVLLCHSRFGLGVMLPGELLPLRSSAAFGHTGASGSAFVLDPAHGLGFAYLTRTMSRATGPDQRAALLLDALDQDLAR